MCVEEHGTFGRQTVGVGGIHNGGRRFASFQIVVGTEVSSQVITECEQNVGAFGVCLLRISVTGGGKGGEQDAFFEKMVCLHIGIFFLFFMVMSCYFLTIFVVMECCALPAFSM